MADVALDPQFRMLSGIPGKPAKSRELSALLYLRGSPLIPMPAWQTAGLNPSGRRFPGSVTVYLAQKTTVYRQVYRHNAVYLAAFGETTVDGRLAKSRITSMAYGRPETY